MIIYVTDAGCDKHGRPVLKNVEYENVVYVDFSRGKGNPDGYDFNIPGDWHVMYRDSYVRVSKDVRFIILPRYRPRKAVRSDGDPMLRMRCDVNTPVQHPVVDEQAKLDARDSMELPDDYVFIINTLERSHGQYLLRTYTNYFDSFRAAMNYHQANHELHTIDGKCPVCNGVWEFKSEFPFGKYSMTVFTRNGVEYSAEIVMVRKQK